MDFIVPNAFMKIPVSVVFDQECVRLEILTRYQGDLSWSNRNIMQVKITLHLEYFLPPAWKVCQGYLAIWWSVHLFVRLSVIHNSVPLTKKVQYLKFGWSYSYQIWTVV